MLTPFTSIRRSTLWAHSWPYPVPKVIIMLKVIPSRKVTPRPWEYSARATTRGYRDSNSGIWWLQDVVIATLPAPFDERYLNVTLELWVNRRQTRYPVQNYKHMHTSIFCMQAGLALCFLRKKIRIHLCMLYFVFFSSKIALIYENLLNCV